MFEQKNTLGQSLGFLAPIFDLIENVQSLGFLAPIFDLIENVQSLGLIKSYLRRLIVMANLKSGDKILDVGCGTGTLTIMIKRMFGDSVYVAGIDPASKLLKVAERKTMKAGVCVDFQSGVIEEIPFQKECFDVVFCVFVLHHLPYRLKVEGLKEVFKVLKSGGKSYIVDYAKHDNLLRYIARILYYPQTSILEHGEFLMRGGLPSLLENIGFMDVQVLSRFSPLITAIYYGKKP